VLPERLLSLKGLEADARDGVAELIIDAVWDFLREGERGGQCWSPAGGERRRAPGPEPVPCTGESDPEPVPCTGKSDTNAGSSPPWKNSAGGIALPAGSTHHMIAGNVKFGRSVAKWPSNLKMRLPQANHFPARSAVTLFPTAQAAELFP
jgi:hypothetical protein